MLDKFVPTKVYRTWYKLPSFDGTAKSLVRRKQKLYNRAKISNKPDHWNDYKHIQKLTNKHLKKAHRATQIRNYQMRWRKTIQNNFGITSSPSGMTWLV